MDRYSNVPVQARRSSRPSAALWILAAVATLFFLRYAKALLIPIALAVLITYALEPVVAWLARHRLPRLAAAAIVMLLLLGGIAAGGWSLRDDVQQAAEALPRAVERVQGLLPPALAGGERGAVGTSGGVPGGLVNRGVSALAEGAGQVVVVFFLTFFLLVSGPLVRTRIVETAGAATARGRMVAAIIDDIDRPIQRYLLVLLVTGAIVATATWGVLAWMGVAHAAMWGLLAGLFNSIPYFGPAIVSGGLFAVGIMQDGGVAQALQMAGAAIVITSLEGWLLTPALMGKAEGMNPLTVFLGLLLWTWVWGGWGTILAVPMLVVVKSVADHVERLRPIGRLMAP